MHAASGSTLDGRLRRCKVVVVMVKVMVQGEWRRRRPRRRWEAGIDTRGRAHSTHSTHRTHSTHSTHAKPAHTHTRTRTRTFSERLRRAVMLPPKTKCARTYAPAPPHTQTHTPPHRHTSTHRHTHYQPSFQYRCLVGQTVNGSKFKRRRSK